MFSNPFKKKEQCNLTQDSIRKFAIDVEYISDCQSIVELSIVEISLQPSVVFYRRFNPFGEEKFRVNRFASEITKIPEASLLKMDSFRNSLHEIKGYLNGSSIFSWGSDLTILNKMYERFGHDILLPNSVVDVQGYLKAGKLRGHYEKVFGPLQFNYEAHCSRIDALMLAYIYTGEVAGLKPEIDLNSLNEWAKNKQEEALIYSEELKAAKRARPASVDGRYKKLGWKIYFSSFSNAEKNQLKDCYSSLGFHVMSNKSPNLTFIIFPDSKKDLAQNYTHNAKCVVLSEFLKLVEQAA